MLRAIRRGCTANCLGCLLPILALLALIGYAIHLWTTPPGYPRVEPAPAATIELSIATAVAHALSSGQAVALVHLSDAEATGLLQDSLTSYDGLDELQVHVFQDRVVVSGETTILHRPLVISGPVDFGGIGKSVIKLKFARLAIGQMGLPSLIPQALARGFHPTFSLGLVDVGRKLTFSCEAARQDDLIVGVTFAGTKLPRGANACAASS
ncbi:MAG: hypothetical protein ACREN1_04060 [Candidatus Dormibacteria bacterium]